MRTNLLLLLALACALTACGASELWSAVLALLLLLPACFQPADEVGGSGGGATAGGGTSGGRAGGGSGGGGGTGGGTTGTGGGATGNWEPCCIVGADGGRFGVISTCYCPPATACNYGWFTNCGNNTCTPFFGGTSDAGPCAP